MRLTLVLTHRCDLACSYCYAGPKDARDMPRAVGARALDRALVGLRAGETLDLGLFGGEPLLVWPLARDLIRRARRRARARGVGLAVQVTTNGTHLTPTVLDELVALDVALTLSMDGLPEVHDAFRPGRGGAPSSPGALRALDLLVGRGVPFWVNMVVRPETVDRLAAGARFLAERGARRLLPSLDYGAAWQPADGARLAAAVAGLRRLYVARFPALEVGWLETKALLLADPQLARPRCGAGVGEVAVAPSGRLYPCERLVGDDRPGPDDAGWGHVDAGSGPLRLEGCAPVAAPQTALGTALGTSPGADAPCGACALEPVCAHDCACANLARTGRSDLPDGLICALEQACAAEAARALEQIPRRSVARRPTARWRRLPVLEAQGA